MKDKRTILKYILVSMLTICVLISGCGIQFFADKLDREETETEEYSMDFDTFARDVAVSFLSTSELTVKQFISNRADFGIEEVDHYWYDYTIETYQEYYDDIESIYNHLLQFDYEALSTDQQNTYDLFSVFLEGELSGRDHFLIKEIFTPQMGTHADIPFSLSLYTFDNKEELDTYLNIVKDTERYLNECADYQIARSEAGYFMRDDYAQWVIEECQEIIDNATTIFTEDFDARVNASDWLTATEKDEYIALNLQYIEEYIIPSYEHIIETLESLKGTGMDGMGLYRFEDGKEYYTRLVQKKAGSDRTVDEIYNLLDTQIDRWVDEIELLMYEVDFYNIFPAFEEYLTPESIIENNLEQMQDRFPVIEGMDGDFYQSYFIPSFLEGVVAGMYTYAQMDNPFENNIYYSRNAEGYYLYEVISHEAVPGHLYQTVYFLTSDVANKELRYLLIASQESLATLEGWTTYIEEVSFEMAGLSRQEARYLSVENNLISAVISCVDIGIHYYGWDERDVDRFLRQKRINTWFSFNEYLYQIMDTNPTLYLPYVIGYIDIMEMIERAQDELGDAYSEYEFHTFYLENSSLRMNTIKEQFEIWLAYQKRANRMAA